MLKNLKDKRYAIVSVAIVLALLSFVFINSNFFDNGSSQDLTITPLPTAMQQSYNFRYPDRLTSHYQKHGIEMGFASESEYLAAANYSGSLL